LSKDGSPQMRDYCSRREGFFLLAACPLRPSGPLPPLRGGRGAPERSTISAKRSASKNAATRGKLCPREAGEVARRAEGGLRALRSLVCHPGRSEAESRDPRLRVSCSWMNGPRINPFGIFRDDSRGSLRGGWKKLSRDCGQARSLILSLSKDGSPQKRDCCSRREGFFLRATLSRLSSRPQRSGEPGPTSPRSLPVEPWVPDNASRFRDDNSERSPPVLSSSGARPQPQLRAASPCGSSTRRSRPACPSIACRRGCG
jgi:hypothetical protein